MSDAANAQDENAEKLVTIQITVPQSVASTIESKAHAKRSTTAEFLASIAVNSKTKERRPKSSGDQQEGDGDAQKWADWLTQWNEQYNQRATRYQGQMFDRITSESESDHFVGILGGILIENALEHFLCACWKNSDQTLLKKAVESSPLASFSSQAVVARLAGFIGPITFQHLKMFLEIRNLCAHRFVLNEKTATQMSFDNTPLKDFCESMTMYSDPSITWHYQDRPIRADSPRNKFVMNVCYLSMLLASHAEKLLAYEWPVGFIPQNLVD